MRKKMVPSATTLEWEWKFSECGRFVIWSTELKKEFKPIWFGSRDYFIHCGFIAKFNMVEFHYPFSGKTNVKRNLKKSQKVRDRLIEYVKNR